MQTVVHACRFMEDGDTLAACSPISAVDWLGKTRKGRRCLVPTVGEKFQMK